MAHITALSSGELDAPTPTAAYINLTRAMQAFYAARGMWLNGQPQGVLASMLGERTPWKTQCDNACFWVTPDQIDALWQDITLSPAAQALSGQQCGQFLRRLKEAQTRAGLPRFAARAMGEPMRHVDVRAPASRPIPFTPLVCPPAGTKVRQAFEKHVFDCLREIVDFQQTSAYGA